VHLPNKIDVNEGFDSGVVYSNDTIAAGPRYRFWAYLLAEPPFY